MEVRGEVVMIETIVAVYIIGFTITYFAALVIAHQAGEHYDAAWWLALLWPFVAINAVVECCSMVVGWLRGK